MSARSTSAKNPEETAYRQAYGITLSSRVRLARNLHGVPFPDKAPPAVRTEVRLQVMAAARAVLPIQESLPDCTPLFRQSLFEDHLISRSLLDGRPESAICMNPEHTRAVMINEEDHLRIQVLQQGLSLREAWAGANVLDDALEEHLDYAFSSSLGYLTS